MTWEKERLETPAVQRWLPVLLPLALFAAMQAAYGIRYTTNDDATISNLAAGAYGPDRIHLIYVNILFGCLLRPLYLLAEGVNWYMLAQLALILLCCCVLLRLAIERFGAARGLGVYLSILLPFSPLLFYSLQYVRTSALCAATGLALVAATLGKLDRRAWLGIFLVWMGSLLRWDMFCAAGGLSAAVLLSRFFRLARPEKRRAVVTMAALLALVFLSKGVDLLAYRLDDGWNAFAQYNAARTAFSDYKALNMPDYNPFTEQGVSDVQLHLLLRWDYYDGTLFPAERVRQLADLLPGLPLPLVLKRTLSAGVGLLYGENYRWPLALVLAAGAAFLRWNRKSLAFWGTGALLGLEIFYLMLQGRMPHYVESGLQICAVLMFLSALAEGEWRRTPDGRVYLAGFVLLAAVSAVTLCALWPESRYYRATRLDGASDAYERMSADKEHLYLLTTATLDEAEGKDVWHPRPAGFYSNIVFYGGWLSHAPFQEKTLAAYGVTDPIAGAVDNDAVFVDREDIENTAAFASERVGRQVEAVYSGENEIAPYQLRTAEG